jgi:hypothetical protein
MVMKRITTLVIILLVTVAAMAQDQAPLTKQEKKALKMEQKKQTELILAKNTADAISSGHFVLKADQIRGRWGHMMNVDPTINFVAVDEGEAYVQLGSPTGIGYNGLGGVTLRGSITSFNVEREKKYGGYNIIMNTIGVSGALTIVMHVNVTGEMATASVATNWGSRVDFDGVLVPWTGKNVYKGTETF